MDYEMSSDRFDIEVNVDRIPLIGLVTDINVKGRDRYEGGEEVREFDIGKGSFEFQVVRNEWSFDPHYSKEEMEEKMPVDVSLELTNNVRDIDVEDLDNIENDPMKERRFAGYYVDDSAEIKGIYSAEESGDEGIFIIEEKIEGEVRNGMEESLDSILTSMGLEEYENIV